MEIIDSNFVEVLHDSENSLIELKWKGLYMPSENYKTVFIQLKQFIANNPTKFFISDMSKQPSVAREDQQWVLQDFLPFAKEHNIQKAAIILSKNIFSELYGKEVVKQISQLDKNARFFDAVEKAKAWMLEGN